MPPPIITIEKVTYHSGEESSHVPPSDDHPIRSMNPDYAKTVRMVSVPIQDVDQNDLGRVVGFPLLKPAQKLSRRGVKTCDSSPWEDRTSNYFRGDNNGVWAYVAARMDSVPLNLQEPLKILSEKFVSNDYDPSKGRVVVRDLPTIFDESIPGVYFEVRIDSDTSAEDVESILLDLVEQNIPRIKVSV